MEIWRGLPDDDLSEYGGWPEGWIKTIVQRQNTLSKSKGHKDRYWYSPSGKKYRSMVQVKKAIAESKGVPLEESSIKIAPVKIGSKAPAKAVFSPNGLGLLQRSESSPTSAEGSIKIAPVKAKSGSSATNGKRSRNPKKVKKTQKKSVKAKSSESKAPATLVAGRIPAKAIFSPDGLGLLQSPSQESAAPEALVVSDASGSASPLVEAEIVSSPPVESTKSSSKREKRKPERSPEEPIRIQKYFDEGWFEGEVTETRVDEEGETLYYIVYEDGDQEEVDSSEVWVLKENYDLDKKRQAKEPSKKKQKKQTPSKEKDTWVPHTSENSSLWKVLAPVNGMSVTRSLIEELAKETPPPPSLPENLHSRIPEMVEFFVLMLERQLMYQVKGKQTANETLQSFHFCNNYRELDRGTAYFKSEVLRLVEEHNSAHPDQPMTKSHYIEQVLAMAYYYRQCNLIGSFTNPNNPAKGIPRLGQVDKQYVNFVKSLCGSDVPFFTSAHLNQGFDRYIGYCKSSDAMIRAIAKDLANMPQPVDMRKVCNKLKQLNGVGPFMSWQIACDLEESCCFGPKFKIVEVTPEEAFVAEQMKREEEEERRQEEEKKKRDLETKEQQQQEEEKEQHQGEEKEHQHEEKKDELEQVFPEATPTEHPEVTPQEHPEVTPQESFQEELLEVTLPEVTTQEQHEDITFLQVEELDDNDNAIIMGVKEDDSDDIIMGDDIGGGFESSDGHNGGGLDISDGHHDMMVEDDRGDFEISDHNEEDDIVGLRSEFDAEQNKTEEEKTSEAELVIEAKEQAALEREQSTKDSNQVEATSAGEESPQENNTPPDNKPPDPSRAGEEIPQENNTPPYDKPPDPNNNAINYKFEEAQDNNTPPDNKPPDPNNNGISYKYEEVDFPDDFCELGPGAEKGLRKIFGDEIFKTFKKSELVGLAGYLRDSMDYCLGLVNQQFPLWKDRKVTLKVIEHALCEFQKFAAIEVGGKNAKGKGGKGGKGVMGQRQYHSRAELDERPVCCSGSVMIRCDTCHWIGCGGCQRDQFQSVRNEEDGAGWNCCHRCHALDQLELV